VYEIKEKTMKKKLAWSLVVSLVLMLCMSPNLMAKSGNPDNGDTEAQIDVAFPDLDLKILDIEIPADLTPLVTFTIADTNGRPLDIDGVLTPGVVDPRMMLTYVPMGEEQKVTYHSESRGRDQNGVYTMLAPGLYTYKFGTVLPADYERNATHTLAVAGRRDLQGAPYYLARYYNTQILDFVPSGASEPIPRDIVTWDTCARCHQEGWDSHHFARYKEVSACTQCHNPDYLDQHYSFNTLIHSVHASNDPDVGTVHYPVAPDSGGLHDCQVCHTGGTPTTEFPLVAGPNPMPACEGSGAGETTLSWEADGKVEVWFGDKLFATSDGDGTQATGKWVHDGDVFILKDAASGEVLQELPVNTTVYGCTTNAPGTFRGTPGLQHTAWMTRPARAVCGGCHDDVDFESGEDHPPQSNDDSCGLCHKPTSGEEWDLSVTGAHTVAYKSYQLPGLFTEVKNVEFTAPGNKLRVTFSLRDKFGNVHPSELDQLDFRISGPNEDFDVYITERAEMSDLEADGQNWTYRFSTPIPMDAEGSYSLAVDGRAESTLERVIGDDFEWEDQMQNIVYPFAVTDDEAVPRRVVVDDAKCEDCHGNLQPHGTNRNNATEYCNVCHQADWTDEAVRPPGTGPSVGIHFNYMVHNIHMGAASYVPYTVYGYRSSFHDYSDVHYPGHLENCAACHADVETGGRNPEPETYWLPLPDGVLDTVAPSDYWSPLQPAAASCMSCHDYPETASHIDLQTGDFGESCNTCHGVGKSSSVEYVHER